MDKSMVTAVVDAIFVFLGFVLAKYLAPEWGDALKGFLLALQPVVIYFVCRWLNIELLIRAGVLSK